MPPEVYFRAGIGLIIANEDGLIFAAERADLPGSWQAPQGGLRRGEEPIDAARRELVEETGIPWSEVEVLAEYPEWLAYELPAESRSAKTDRGQVQKWFLLRYVGDESNIELAAGEAGELARWKWLPLGQLADQTWHIRRPIYRRLAEAWGGYLD